MSHPPAEVVRLVFDILAATMLGVVLILTFAFILVLFFLSRTYFVSKLYHFSIHVSNSIGGLFGYSAIILIVADISTVHCTIAVILTDLSLLICGGIVLSFLFPPLSFRLSICLSFRLSLSVSLFPSLSFRLSLSVSLFPSLSFRLFLLSLSLSSYVFSLLCLSFLCLFLMSLFLMSLFLISLFLISLFLMSLFLMSLFLIYFLCLSFCPVFFIWFERSSITANTEKICGRISRSLSKSFHFCDKGFFFASWHLGFPCFCKCGMFLFFISHFII
jgi:hypothetical protein